MDTNQQAVVLHQKYQGKIGVSSLFPVKTRQQLSLAYTPGVAEPCRLISNDKTQAYDLTCKGRLIAVISDGSAVLGLGNIGPEASLPVMEGKAMLLKEFGQVDAIPLVINTQNSQEIINFVKQVAPSFAGINLEDIGAPRCFEIEEALQDIGIPVFHDVQHGTAIVVSAALHNAAKVVGKPFGKLKVVVVGAGAAGIAISKMLLGFSGNKISKTLESVADLVLVDSQGAIHRKRSDVNTYKKMIAQHSNKNNKQGSLKTVIKGMDVVVGVSQPEVIIPKMIASMAPKAIVFAMANPTPEIMPQEAQAAGAAIVATGRSDFANQINNVLAFPGIFQAVVRGRLTKITPTMKQAAAQALAQMVEKPNPRNIIPDPFTPNLASIVADAILKTIS